MRRWLALFVAAAFAAGAGAQADPDKVLRVVFRVAETGFDPQAVSDLYSNYVNRVTWCQS
jgi:oligopeptide transport system substrate-binding protein